MTRQEISLINTSICEFFRTVIRVIDGRIAEVDKRRVVEDRLESHID